MSTSWSGLADGADWDVTFLPFTLSQGHVPEGGTPVWDDPAKFADLVALAAGVVVRDQYPDAIRDSAPRHCSRPGTTTDSTSGTPPSWPGVLDAPASPADKVLAEVEERRADRRDQAGPPGGGHQVERLRGADVHRRRTGRSSCG